MPSTLIIGAGAFGASTALALASAGDADSRITLVDRSPYPSPAAAVHDINKIVRAEYEDARYMRLALESQAAWRADPNLAPLFHTPGILWSVTREEGEEFVRNYEALLGKGNSPAVVIGLEDARRRFGGLFRDGKWCVVEAWLWNPKGGWAETSEALRRIVARAVELGVEHVSSGVDVLLFDGKWKCMGARTCDGRIFEADRVVVSTGAYTPKLLADSAPTWKELQVGGRMVAAGATMGKFTVSEEESEKFSEAPVVVHDKGPWPAESIPFAPGKPGIVKCTHEVSFTNKTVHEASGQVISVPILPDSPDSQWTAPVPQGVKDEVGEAKNKMYGNYISSMEPFQYRMCWDAITPSMDWVICPHPHSENLFMATGGSFHGAKFLPIIGKYVVEMLDGKLDADLAKLWAWDKPSNEPIGDPYFPFRDIKDIKPWCSSSGIGDLIA